MRIEGKLEAEVHAQVKCGYLTLYPFPNGSITVECLNSQRKGFVTECDFLKNGKCRYRDSAKTIGEIMAERAMSFASNLVEALDYVDKCPKKEKA